MFAGPLSGLKNLVGRTRASPSKLRRPLSRGPDSTRSLRWRTQDGYWTTTPRPANFWPPPKVSRPSLQAPQSRLAGRSCANSGLLAPLQEDDRPAKPRRLCATRREPYPRRSRTGLIAPNELRNVHFRTAMPADRLARMVRNRADVLFGLLRRNPVQAVWTQSHEFKNSPNRLLAGSRRSSVTRHDDLERLESA